MKGCVEIQRLKQSEFRQSKFAYTHDGQYCILSLTPLSASYLSDITCSKILVFAVSGIGIRCSSVVYS